MCILQRSYDFYYTNLIKSIAEVLNNTYELKKISIQNLTQLLNKFKDIEYALKPSILHYIYN